MKIILSVTVDVDNDDMTTDGNRQGDRWTSIALIPSISAIFERAATPATWFIRADDQVKLNFGSTTHFLHAYHRMWRDLESNGHEIAWHPHLYARIADGSFVPEYEDKACSEQLVRTFAEIYRSGWKVHSVRIGEAYNSNAITATLRSLEIEADSTAIPGRYREQNDKRLDWRSTPNSPYFPDSTDYRKPALLHNGSTLVQVPMTTVPIKAAYDFSAIPRYINLAFHPTILLERLGAHLDSLSEASTHVAWLTTILHPDEIASRPRPHALYAFSIHAVEANLNGLLHLVRSRGWDLECTTVRHSATIARTHLSAGSKL